MKWDKVEVKTEQVIDEDPQTWLNAAQEDFNAGNYDSALEKLQQARVFSNNDPGISCLTYAQEVFIYLAQDNKAAARESSRLLRERGNSVKLPNGLSGFEGLVIKNPILAHFCMDINPYDDFWYKTWLAAVDDVIEEQDFDLIEDILVSEEIYSFTEKTLADRADDDFARAVVKNSKLKLLEALYRGGFNLSTCKSSSGRNLTMEAVINNSSSDILDFLLNKNINGVDAKDKYGWTALMHSNGYENLTMLINAGANVNALNNKGQTALILAAQLNDIYKVRRLIDSGADVSRKDSDGCDALLYTSKSDCLKLLINAGANVNALNNKGQTALILAAQRNDANSIRLLIESGVNVSCKDSYDCDAIFYTGNEYNEQCLRLLAEHGANINQHYAYAGKQTLLHKVAKSEHWKNSFYWEALLNLGADVNATDNYGSTPLEYALDHSWTFTAELDLPRALVKKGATVTYGAKQVMRRRGIKESNLYNKSTNFFFSSWFN